MADELNIYGESAGSVGGAVLGNCTSLCPTDHEYLLTKAQCTMEGIGYAYIQVGAVNRYAFYFWGAGAQSEDNLTMRIVAGETVRGWVVQAGGVQVTRMALTGYDTLAAM